MLLGVFCVSCSNISTPETSGRADKANGSRDGKRTQYEAEQAAIAEFEKHNGGAKITDYQFDRLIYRDFPPERSTMSGYFLCGQIEYRDPTGTRHGPRRVMVYIAKNFQPALILYDSPELGRFDASSFCQKVQASCRNPRRLFIHSNGVWWLMPLCGERYPGRRTCKVADIQRKPRLIANRNVLRQGRS